MGSHPIYDLLSSVKKMKKIIRDDGVGLKRWFWVGGHDGSSGSGHGLW